MSGRGTSSATLRVVVLSHDATEPLRCGDSFDCVHVEGPYEAAAEILVAPALALAIDLRTLGRTHLGLLDVARRMDVEMFAFGPIPAGMTAEDLSGVRLISTDALPGALEQLRPCPPDQADADAIDRPSDHLPDQELTPAPADQYEAPPAGVPQTETDLAAGQPDQADTIDQLGTYESVDRAEDSVDAGALAETAPETPPPAPPGPPAPAAEAPDAIDRPADPLPDEGLTPAPADHVESVPETPTPADQHEAAPAGAPQAETDLAAGQPDQADTSAQLGTYESTDQPADTVEAATPAAPGPDADVPPSPAQPDPQPADTQTQDDDQALAGDVLLTPEEITALLGEKP